MICQEICGVCRHHVINFIRIQRGSFFGSAAYVNEEDFLLFSGLANGIDRLSHISCMTNGGKTIAVLAHGLDMVYPAANKQLANDILTAGGTLMSEYPVGTPPVKYRFVNRNRLIVGLSGFCGYRFA